VIPKELKFMSDIHWKELKNLILVAGHAIYTAESFNDPTDEMLDASKHFLVLSKAAILVQKIELSN